MKKNIAREDISTDPNLDLWLLIANTRNAMFQAARKEYISYGVSPGQAHVLRIIQNLGEKATLTEVSRQACRAIHTISARINGMGKKGLLKKIRDLPGTTLTRFELTEHGLEAYKVSEKRESMEKIMSILSQEERQQLTSTLNKLLNQSNRLH